MTDEEFKSVLANSFAKAETEIAKLAEENRETDRQIKALKEAIADTSRSIDKVLKQMGGINDNIGFHAEQFFQNVFEKKKVFGGIKYDDIIKNMAYKGKTGGVEFDIVLENGNAVALIEAKNRIHPGYVKNLAEERIAKFRKYFPEYKDYDVYLGIAGFSFDDSVLEEAKAYGVGIVKQLGEGIEVDTTNIRAYRPQG